MQPRLPAPAPHRAVPRAGFTPRWRRLHRRPPRLGGLLVGVCLCLPASASLAAQTCPRAVYPDDRDNDGLPDWWEAERRSWGLSPARANLVLVPVNRASVPRHLLEPTVAQVVAFYGRVPMRNPDGSTGIGVVVRWGNPLPDSEGDVNVERSTAIPAHLLGRSHGVLIGPEPGGGGQTLRGDWAYSSNDWQTVSHELGHQLGLGHEPAGSGVPSPFYASIMNYDYMSQLNGDPGAVRFSRGRLSSLRLDERDLDETLPFPAADLQFLAGPPYRFTLRSVGPASTQVDFNRNGVLGETHVQADINAGTSVFLSPRSQRDLGRTTGSFALAQYRGMLVGIYSTARGVDYDTYAGPGLSPGTPGNLMYQVWDGVSLGPERLLMSAAVAGTPHAVQAFGALFVTVPVINGYTVVAYTADRWRSHALALAGFTAEPFALGTHPVLVRLASPERLVLLEWNEITRRVRWRPVLVRTAGGVVSGIALGPRSDVTVALDGRFEHLAPVSSNSPVGATWNSRTERIAMLTTGPSRNGAGGAIEHRLKLHELVPRGDQWVSTGEKWLTSDVSSWTGTRDRPTILYDERPLNGEYLVYFRSDYLFETGEAHTFLVRLDPGARDASVTGPDAPYRWFKGLMGNDWVLTRSAPAAAMYGRNAAFGWRLSEVRYASEARNRLVVHLEANGKTESNLTDYDDVTHIACRGMRESLGLPGR